MANINNRFPRHFQGANGISDTFYSQSSKSSASERDSSDLDIRYNDMPALMPSVTKSSLKRRDFLVPFVPPKWAADLKDIPKYRVQLCNTQTPIHKWNLPGIPDDIEIFIKRDDMSGADLSGNKTRRLEFLLADAIDKGCSSVITAGDISSNHCRCMAIAGRRFGLQSHLVLRAPTANADELPCRGNSLLYRMTGAQIYLTPLHADYLTELKPRVEQLVHILKKEHNEEAYPIHYGGSSGIGVFGCLEAYDELIHQNVQDDFTDIVVTISSVGEAAGLAIGNYLTGSKLSIHGFCFSCDTATTQGKINRLVDELGVRHTNNNVPDAEALVDVIDSTDVPDAEELVDVIDSTDYDQYGIPTKEEVHEFICEVATSTGIILDPTYTGKTALSLVRHLQHNPGRFKGKKILFIHTGGIFGLFDGPMESVVKQQYAGNIRAWTHFEDDPLQTTLNGYH